MNVKVNHHPIEDTSMALTELTAIDHAYRALEPLGDAARRRALQWLSAALEEGAALPDATAGAPEEAPQEAPEPEQPTDTAAAPRTPRRRAAKVAAAKTTSASKGRRRTRGVESPQKSNGERAYRRMPDPDEIMNAYTEVGTVSGLAEYFGVPKYTVNHWARRLRGQGFEIGRSS
jgi:hypothetical protein